VSTLSLVNKSLTITDHTYLIIGEVPWHLCRRLEAFYKGYWNLSLKDYVAHFNGVSLF
jgi:hypothetical protein